MDASFEHESLNGDTEWRQFFSPAAFEHIKPWIIREKKLIRVSAVFCLASFVATLIVCAFMCTREPAVQLPPAQAVLRRCDPGWSEHGERCYKLLVHKSFYEANHECRHDYGGELASVHSKAQSDFLGGHGLKRAWTDGTPLDFQNWSTDVDEDKPDRVDTSELWCVLVVNGNYDDRTQWAIRRCGRDGETAICQKDQ